MTTNCPFGNENCPVVTGPPMQHGIDCQYCKTMLSPQDIAKLTPEQKAYLKLKRNISPMRGGIA